MMHNDPAGGFAAVFAALFVAHQLADHWVQTDRQACRKALPGPPGRLACTLHVATYTATAVLTLAAVVLLLAPVDPLRAAVGLAVSAVTHWAIDRRRPLIWLAEHAGRGALLRLGAPRPGRDDNPSLGTGLYALDQSAHYLFLFVAALVMVA
jgi:hypothetical protein